jgi:hypothetical protein
MFFHQTQYLTLLLRLQAVVTEAALTSLESCFEKCDSLIVLYGLSWEMITVRKIDKSSLSFASSLLSSPSWDIRHYVSAVPVRAARQFVETLVVLNSLPRVEQNHSALQACV